MPGHAQAHAEAVDKRAPQTRPPPSGPGPAPGPAPRPGLGPGLGPSPAPSRQPGVPTVDWLGLYLLEDLGPGDVTADALFPADVPGEAVLVARAPCVVAGLRHAVEVFARLGAVATLVGGVRDGQPAAAGSPLLRVAGPARAILAGERVALNLVGRMSGIATATRSCVDALAAAAPGPAASGRPALVAATRKTTPGFRAFEKEAVELGGGTAHRMGLWDAAMLKDNHLEAWCGKAIADAAPGDVAAVADAVRQVVAANPGKEVTCEAESLEHALAAAGAGATWVLIDNQEPATGAAWAKAIRARHPDVRVEASGGIRPANIAGYAWADRVSLGHLTQASPASDVALDWAHPRSNP